MADTKISALTSGNPAQSGDEIPIARTGANYKITAGSIAALASVSPAGSDTYVQFNDAGSFGADAGLAYNKTTNTLSTERVNLGTAGAASGILTLSGSTSGTVTLQPAAAAGTYTLTLPTSDGSSGEVLTTDGSGGLSWSVVAASPGGSSGQLQYNNAGAFGGTSGITTTGTELTIASGTKTASAPVLDITQTWNNAAVTFTGLKLNVTNTASAVASLLADLQLGGTSKFNIDKSGIVTVAEVLRVRPSAQTYFEANQGNFVGLFNGTPLRFSTGTGNEGELRLDAANTLAQRNGTNAQTLRVYNTYTDASNYERGFFRWAANVLEIGAEKAGTGTDRNVTIYAAGNTIQISPGGSSTWKFDGVAGSFLANSDNAFDIGAAAANRPRAIYAAGLISGGTLRMATAYTVATLPAAGTAGRRAYVTDATTPTFLGTLTGGGAVVCPVFDNGTAWVAG